MGLYALVAMSFAPSDLTRSPREQVGQEGQTSHPYVSGQHTDIVMNCKYNSSHVNEMLC